jgi:hypothetical protein
MSSFDYMYLFAELAGNNGCPYTGNIFTIKIELQCTRIFFTIKTVIISYFCLISDFFNGTNLQFFISEVDKVPLPFHFLIWVFFPSTAIQILSPAAPSAALAASRRPHLSTAGAPVAATRVVLVLVVVVGSGAAPPL